MQSRANIVPSLPIPQHAYMGLRRHVMTRKPCSPLQSYWKPVDRRALDTSLLDNMRTDGTLFREAVHLATCSICLKARPS